MTTKYVFKLITLSVFSLAFSLGARSQDAYKTLLRRSAMCIHKAQKHMIVAGKNEVGGKLAQAVLLQTYANKLYTTKKLTDAASASLEARRLAFEIGKEINHPKSQPAQYTDDEKKLAAGGASTEKLMADSKKELKLSSTDKDYINPASLNTSNIDLK